MTIEAGPAPVVVVPDMSPLIHLAAAGQLPLLHEFGRVVVMDIVAHEATGDMTRPWAREVAAWLREGRRPGAGGRVEIATTEIGEAYRLARQAKPDFRMRDAGERAIRDWLVDALPHLGGPALVIYEDKRMPRLIEREKLGNMVVVATTRAVLIYAQERGLLESAEDTWNSITQRAGGANPGIDLRVLRPRHGP